MKVIICRKDKPTRNHGWITRRANETLRSIFFSYAMTDVIGGSSFQGVSVKIIGVDGPPTSILQFEVSLPDNWEMERIEKFLNYMRNAKNISTALLTQPQTSDTMLPCPT